MESTEPLADEQTGDEVATAVISIPVAAGGESAFLGWQADVNRVAGSFPGFLGTETIQPSDAEADFVVIVRFASAQQLSAWLNSPERAAVMSHRPSEAAGAEAASVVIGSSNVQAPEPVTALIRDRVTPGHETSYRDWQRRMRVLMAKQPGYLGANVQEPIPGLQPEWLIMARFDSEEHLAAWLRSDARARMLAEAAPAIARTETKRARTSFDGWFRFDDDQPPPSAWQQSALVLLTLFPIVALEIKYLNPLLQWMPFAPAVFLGNVISVAVTGFLLVPWAVRAFEWWLSPRAPRARIWLGAGLIMALYLISIILMEWVGNLWEVVPITRL